MLVWAGAAPATRQRCRQPLRLTLRSARPSRVLLPRPHCAPSTRNAVSSP
jgi:hypothetical protein